MAKAIESIQDKIIKTGFLLCPGCGKKIQPIGECDVIVSTTYCHICKSYWKTVYVDGELLKMERNVIK